jgi:hypothetical protein
MKNDIVIEPIREVSDEVAADEIYDIVSERCGIVSVAEIAEKTRFPFEQIEKIVNDWS